MATFRQTLWELLDKKGINLTDLANQSGIAYQTLKGYTSQNAGRKPSVPVLIAIAKAIDVSLDAFRDCDDLQMEQVVKQTQEEKQEEKHKKS